MKNFILRECFVVSLETRRNS